ncbi:MAG: FtsW/RodA/SpoVE family cell cycle protein [Clostridia bacterium]|nr:FtsW/RodA/SpoVE family cell cycle protein [Clostridia bacterium]
MDAFFDVLITVSRYALLLIAVYVVARVLMAMFFKKTTNPVRGRLINAVTGEVITLRDNEISIGRNKNCDVVLGFDTISRLHAVIAYRNKGFEIFDTNSKSGVTVNGEKIKGKASLVKGDVVGFGGLEYTLTVNKFRYIKDKSSKIAQPGYMLILTLLTVFNLLTLLLTSFPQGQFEFMVASAFLGMILTMWGYYFFASLVLRITNFELESIAFLFSSVGLGIVASMYPEGALKQFFAIVIGVLGFCFLLYTLRFLDVIKVFRYILGAGAIGLLAVTLIIAEPTNGALSWINIGGVSLQPSEFVKVAFIFVGAVTLERLQSVRHLTMYIAFAAICVIELFLMYDFGAALIFFFTFVVIAFMRSGDIRTIMLICIAAALGAVLILLFKPYVAARFSGYMHIWENMDTTGYQQTRTLIYSASGGLLGLGLGNGELRHIFAAAEDLVFGVVSEEFGLIMGFLIPLTYAFVAVATVINAQKAKSAFYAISGVAASSLILFQTMLNVFGVTDLLPLTGVTLPFVSKGGSSIICCFCLLAFIKSVDVRTFSNFKVIEAEEVSDVRFESEE